MAPQGWLWYYRLLSVPFRFTLITNGRILQLCCHPEVFMTGALLMINIRWLAQTVTEKFFFLKYWPALLSSSSACQYLLGLQASTKMMEGETTVSLKMLTVFSSALTRRGPGCQCAACSSQCSPAGWRQQVLVSSVPPLYNLKLVIKPGSRHNHPGGWGQDRAALHLKQ